MTDLIPFNRPPVTGRELEYIADVIASRRLAGNGQYTQRCHSWLKAHLGVQEALLTQSCTAALEMAAILCDLEPGDEVIMPSYTFVSTANAVVLRSAVPVFVDVRRDTLNIDETKIEAAITNKTKAIFVVHYAGVPAAMEPIMTIARRHKLLVVEDAAQALQSRYRDRPAGALADIGCFSFHETKNIVTGEGGALVTTDPGLAERAHVVWEKGTNRREFFEGRVDKYTWIDKGSSFLPSELTAAFLWAQLEEVDAFTKDRLASWHIYHRGFADLEARNGLVVRPTLPDHIVHNGHLYYLLLPDNAMRDALIAGLQADEISAPFHYVPLHSSPAGRRYGRISGDLSVTSDIAARLIRLPLWVGMASTVDRVVDTVRRIVAAAS